MIYLIIFFLKQALIGIYGTMTTKKEKIENLEAGFGEL